MEYRIFESKYYEDFNIGDHWVTPTRTITETDIVQFNNLAWISSQIFTDEEFIKGKTLFKRRFATGVITIPLMLGLVMQLHLVDESALAMLGLETTFARPLFPGDTIHVEVEVTSKRETSKADRGIVHLKYTTKNQESETLAETTEIALIRRKAGLV